MQVPENQMKIRPPLSASSSKDVAALKAELELELKKKKQCTYKPYECSLLTLDGYNYCEKHILHDKSAPFKQCSFVYATNGKRCQQAAPRFDKKDLGYCNEHAVRSTLSKNRQNSKCPPPQTPEVLLYSLGHYVRKPRKRTASETTDEGNSNEDGELKATRSLDPFRDIDPTNYNATSNNILDFCSESDSDVEASTFATVWHDAQNDSSDNESVDSEQDDFLKHANVYTAEEISSITRDKLSKLQSLYIEQYRHLQHVFKEKKRKYYHNLKREKETCCNIYNQIRENPKEQRLYKKLKALNKYHKTHGVEAILNKRLHDSRAKVTDGIFSKPTTYPKCMFSEGGVKCGERTLPLARHCRKHILEDPNQVLFRACGKKKVDVECPTPIESIFDDACCQLHLDIPPIKSYAQLRKNSESDFEDSFDSPDVVEIENVKTELVDYQQELGMKMLPSDLLEESSLELSIKNEHFMEKTEEEDALIDVGEPEEGNLEIDMKQEVITEFKENESAPDVLNDTENSVIA